VATLLSALETQARRHLLEPAALATPGSITVTPLGTTGAATWTYKLVAINATGTTEAGAASSTTTGNATLDGTNYNRLTWTAVAGATGYWIYRTASGGTPASTGRIVVLGAVTTYDDQGATGDSATAPVSNSSGLTSPFWSSAELIDIVNQGIKDLWGAVIDLFQEHYLTIDTTNVSYTAEAESLSGIPTDVFRVFLIEPKDTTQLGTYRNIVFAPRDYNSPEFTAARSRTSANPVQDSIVYYALSGAGAPVGAPTVLIAPKLSVNLPAGTIRFAYNPIIADKISSDSNPIPGESNNALIAWMVAYARAKEREDRSPDPNWLAVYATEKGNILTRLTPRQTHEPDYVEPIFWDYW